MVGRFTLCMRNEMWCECLLIVQALPNIKEYLQSDSCIKRPVNNTIAQWK